MPRLFQHDVLHVMKFTLPGWRRRAINAELMANWKKDLRLHNTVAFLRTANNGGA